MSDLVEKLRAPAYWISGSDEGHEGDNSAPYEAAARIEQLEAEAKTRTLDYLGQVGQLSEELERVKREAERAQDAHGVRFLNYLEETARLTDEVERLRAALLEITILDDEPKCCGHGIGGYDSPPECCGDAERGIDRAQSIARAALEDRT